MISYAQNFEDVMLWRALQHVQNGFYIDIGAQDPVIDSVSLAFHEHGWHGIHVEPTPHYAELLRQQRPGDTIIQSAISDAAGVLNFYEIPETGISTADPVIAQQHRERGFRINEISVPCIVLASVFESCSGKDIHWLKIDVEGFEQQVLSGWGEHAARPWIIVVESTLPLTQIETHASWEALLLERAYSPVYFDGLNRYYVSETHPELKAAFLIPPNVFDGFSVNGTASTSLHHLIKERYEKRLSEAATQIEQQKHTLQTQIDDLAAHEQAITSQLHALQQQAAQEKFELTQQQLAHERIMAREFAQREQTLLQQLQATQQEKSQREQALIEQHNQARQGQEDLLRKLAEREQSIAAQLVNLQQQAAQEKNEQTQQHFAQLQTLKAELAQHEQTLLLQLQATQQELHTREQERAQREQALIEQHNQARQGQEDLLYKLAEREQDFSAQLLNLQQHAAQQIAEQTQQQFAHERRLQSEHTQREQALHEQVQATQQQAVQEKTELAQQYHTQLQILQCEYLQREQTLQAQVQTTQQQLHSLEQERLKREQTIASQLLNLQQQAALEKTEQTQQYHAQLQALQSEYQQREQGLHAQLLAIEQERTRREQEVSAQIQALQQRGYELNNQQEEQQRLLQAAAALEAELNAQFQAEQLASEQLRQLLAEVESHLAQTHASFTWRMTAPLRALGTLFRPEPVPKQQSAPKILAPAAQAPYTQPEIEKPSNSITTEPNMPSFIPTQQPDTVAAANSLDELLAYHDQHFVQCAYLSLLHRAPDPEGMRYYLGRLRNGIPKIQLLAQLRRSAEGLACSAKPSGLDNAIHRYQLGQFPLIGWISRQLTGMEGNNPIERKLRAIENQIFLLGNTSNQRFDQLNATIAKLYNFIDQQEKIEISVPICEKSTEVSRAKNTSPSQSLMPDGFQHLSANARNIYFQLKNRK